MKFKKYYEKHERVYSNPGSHFENEYQLVIKENGAEELEIIGKTDIYQDIQSHRMSVDINEILQRFKNGDEAVLEKVKGFYGDISDMPGNMADFLNMSMRGKELFEGLPIEYKKMYGNNYAAFLANPELMMDAIKANEVDTFEELNKEVKSDDNEE